MFWEVFYFLGNFVQEGLYSACVCVCVCVHNSLWGNSSIDEDGFELVEPTLGLFMLKSGTWRVIEFWYSGDKFFSIVNVLLYLSWKDWLLLKICAGDVECLFSNPVLNCCHCYLLGTNVNKNVTTQVLQNREVLLDRSENKNWNCLCLKSLQVMVNYQQPLGVEGL